MSSSTMVFCKARLPAGAKNKSDSFRYDEPGDRIDWQAIWNRMNDARAKSLVDSKPESGVEN